MASVHYTPVEDSLELLPEERPQTPPVGPKDPVPGLSLLEVVFLLLFFISCLVFLLLALTVHGDSITIRTGIKEISVLKNMTLRLLSAMNISLT